MHGRWEVNIGNCFGLYSTLRDPRRLKGLASYLTQALTQGSGIEGCRVLAQMNDKRLHQHVDTSRALISKTCAADATKPG